MALSREQQKVLTSLIKVGQAKRAPKKDIISAIETGLVEANLTNPVGGGGTSSGWRQEINTYGSVARRRNVHGAAKRFYDELKKAPAGTTGARAQAVQRSAYPGRYQQREREAEQLYSQYAGRVGAVHGALTKHGVVDGVTKTTRTTNIPGVTVSGSPNPVTEADPTAVQALTQFIGQKATTPDIPQPAPIQIPNFSARYNLRTPSGTVPTLPESGPITPPQQSTSLDTLLQQLGVTGQQDASLGASPSTKVPGTSVTSTSLSRAQGASGGGRGGSGHAYKAGAPLARKGKQIGVPHQGTHTLGNWQSDNAVDIATPVGTPVVATEDGTVSKVGGQAGSSGRFAGFSVTLGGKRDNYFYTHLKRRVVKPGQRVRAGQVIGYSGSANGVAHLHFGREHGDPRNNE